MPDPIPRRPEAMKATLSNDVFDDPNWIVERKLDGYRCLAFRDGGKVALESRNYLSLNDRYPEVAAALEANACKHFVVDGEIVGTHRGKSSFEALQQRGHDRSVRISYYVFDILWLDGEDLRQRPLIERKRLLRGTLHFGEPAVRWTPHRKAENGEEHLADACRRGWEGLIAKRGDSRYAGKRSGDWLKWKCSAEQELVIGGFTAPKGSRQQFGALLVGYYEGKTLRYAGKVGTGFDQRELQTLGAQMAKLERKDSPFGAGDPPARGTTWIEPKLVAQIGFSEWTRDGSLRHPRYLGLRDDKPARKVVHERPTG
jgi:bifunctional non-homologous end joining protein LigD